MITSPKEYGGADITPKYGRWENVDSIFALHDNKTNQEWMRDWSKKTFLTREDLDQIRNKFGEKVYRILTRLFLCYLLTFLGWLLLCLFTNILPLSIISSVVWFLLLGTRRVILPRLRDR